MIRNQNKVILINFASTIILQGLTFFSAPIFSRQLGTENYGIVAVYAAWVSLISVVFTLQAGGTIGIARAYFTSEEQPAYQSSVLGLALALYVCFSTLTVLLLKLASGFFPVNPPMLAFALLQACGMYCVDFTNSKHIFEFNADKNVKLSVLVSFLTIGVSFVLIPRFPPEINYWGRIAGLSISYGVIGAVLCVQVFRRGKTFFNYRYWAFTLPVSTPTVFHLLAHNVLGQCDKFMLQIMVSNTAAGIYSLANSFSSIVNVLWATLNKSWVPFYYDYTARHEQEQIRTHTKNYVELFTVITMGFILMEKEVFHIFASEEFWAGVDYVPLFAVSHYFTFLYSFPVNYEFFHKRTKTIAIGTGLAAVCNIVLNDALIRYKGGIGAVIATMVSHIFLFAFHYANARKIFPDEFPFTLPELLCGLPFVLTAYILYLMPVPWFLRWSVSGALGIFICARMIKRRAFF